MKPFIIKKSEVIEDFYYIHRNDRKRQYVGSLSLNEQMYWCIRDHTGKKLAALSDYYGAVTYIQMDELAFQR